ncbi:MAG: lipid-A-disaccharide synthase-related protein [Synechococcales bacterium]|nr:lipid-A-disaccharide synthase-related protein [Synechococcales bacterium]
MKRRRMKLLCLSNGHGEDAIALRILQALQTLPQPPQIEVLPIVGEGHAYTQAGFPLIGSVKQMPSGGFIYMDGKQLARDLQGGLVTLTFEQIRSVTRWAKENPNHSLVLAVGDIVPLLFAWNSRLPYSFVGTAKSEYYLRDEMGWLPRKSWWDDRFAILTGSVYYPWERWFLAHRRCQAVFPRDRITTAQLRQFAIPAYDLGNPMMDLRAPEHPTPISLDSPTGLTCLLLPGSRPPEAYANWQILLAAVQNLLTQFRDVHQFLCPLAPGLDRTPVEQALYQFGWQLMESPLETAAAPGEFTFIHPQMSDSVTLRLAVGQFAPFAEQADYAIAMAGTATEQFVGLGKPVFTLPGAGPQFTPAFAEAQTRLLGPSIHLLPSPEQITPALQELLTQPDRLQKIAENGRQRMGTAGAALRIAQKLIDVMTETTQDSDL